MNIPDLPHKCFVSHSYQDAEALAALLATLPPSVEPFLFPAITVTPDRMVSNDLIRALLECPGVIYLKGGKSNQSFWVAFERDYALRAGKPVFAFDPESRTLRRDTSAPLHLPVFPSFCDDDSLVVAQALEIMRGERFFDMFDPTCLASAGVFQRTLNSALDTRLDQGGYVVLFLSHHSAGSYWIRAETRRGTNFLAADGGLRVIPVWLGHPEDSLAEEPPPGWPADHPYAPLRLSQGPYGSGLNMNRVDDLIVRLYWLICRNTQQNELT
jgi:hypothetical protein